tara:strand:- start:469 stop:729 length:261 start_codon:yes stop_codon:yes gene_type:complete
MEMCLITAWSINKVPRSRPACITGGEEQQNGQTDNFIFGSENHSMRKKQMLLNRQCRPRRQIQDLILPAVLGLENAKALLIPQQAI